MEPECICGHTEDQHDEAGGFCQVDYCGCTLYREVDEEPEPLDFDHQGDD